MSQKHPVIAVTGSSGAGTTTVRHTFETIFSQQNVRAAIIEGDSFHRYGREDMLQVIREQEQQGLSGISHFGPEANLMDELENLFRSYGESAIGRRRLYIHDATEAEELQLPAGTFTEWEDLPVGTDCLFYEGLHGGYVTGQHNIARHVDLLIGVAPTINLEWIQKIHRDTHDRGYSAEVVQKTILRRMHDYVHYIVPQFSRTHINFQRVPVVDTSNPFTETDVPTADESMVVIHFREARNIDFPYLLCMLQHSFMSRADSIVIPGDKMNLAMQLILAPMISHLMSERRKPGS